jgi:hypothetical protein
MTLVVAEFPLCLLFYIIIFEDDRSDFRIAIFLKRESSGLEPISSCRHATPAYQHIFRVS